ncbi:MULTISPECIES: VOC family protein [Robiginitalea]|uniref:Putative glyoxalase n=1 Tax=Robiginitalea biformata (strain ATCC BAA-864 / DSM 15991 / KCTC 12146 / HTCC2501) TaxID=313596 RepID=A4CNH1_ROBBH|nr:MULTISPECIES: VOC family protein [Robiginitalea]EAR14438.1 putative glyoxalase [Robiginitalea biformata HTCC2501]MDC6355072.1 VOC family protein [Robiginitalea sp. PM2]MDC6375339.1 VOC family protein [Robiginitalea sp. SP8]
MEQNFVGWFEIPVRDMDRAKKFYESVLDIEIQLNDMHDLKMGWFPFAPEKPGASGSLVYHKDFYEPSDSKGVMIYLSCGDVAVTLDKITKAGGKVLQEKKQISPDHGYMGLFIDSEGNRMALHSRQ